MRSRHAATLLPLLLLPVLLAAGCGGDNAPATTPEPEPPATPEPPPPPPTPEPPPPTSEPEGTEPRAHAVWIGENEESSVIPSSVIPPSSDSRTFSFYYTPQQAPFVLTVDYYSLDGLTAADFTTRITRAPLWGQDGNTTTGDGHIQVELCNFEKVIVEASTPGNATYAATTTRIEILIQLGGEIHGPRPDSCLSEEKERRHFVRVNGEEYDLGHRPGISWTPGELPKVAGEFMMTIEYESPRESHEYPYSHDRADFRTVITRGGGEVMESDGSISLRLCDYETIIVEATTPRTAIYAAKTTRTEFIVGGGQGGVDRTAPRPYWCERLNDAPAAVFQWEVWATEPIHPGACLSWPYWPPRKNGNPDSTYGDGQICQSRLERRRTLIERRVTVRYGATETIRHSLPFGFWNQGQTPRVGVSVRFEQVEGLDPPAEPASSVMDDEAIHLTEWPRAFWFVPYDDGTGLYEPVFFGDGFFRSFGEPTAPSRWERNLGIIVGGYGRVIVSATYSGAASVVELEMPGRNSPDVELLEYGRGSFSLGAVASGTPGLPHGFSFRCDSRTRRDALRFVNGLWKNWRLPIPVDVVDNFPSEINPLAVLGQVADYAEQIEDAIGFPVVEEGRIIPSASRERPRLEQRFHLTHDPTVCWTGGVVACAVVKSGFASWASPFWYENWPGAGELYAVSSTNSNTCSVSSTQENTPKQGERPPVRAGSK